MIHLHCTNTLCMHCFVPNTQFKTFIRADTKIKGKAAVTAYLGDVAHNLTYSQSEINNALRAHPQLGLPSSAGIIREFLYPNAETETIRKGSKDCHRQRVTCFYTEVVPKELLSAEVFAPTTCTSKINKSPTAMNNLTDMDINPLNDPQDQTIDLTPLKNKDTDLTPPNDPQDQGEAIDLTPLKNKDTDLTPPNDPQDQGEAIDLTPLKNKDTDLTPPNDPQDQTIDLTPLNDPQDQGEAIDLTPLKNKITDLTPPKDPQHHGDQGIDLTLPQNAPVPGDSPESPPPKSPLSPGTDPPPLNNLGKRYLTRSSGTAHPFSKKIKLGKSLYDKGVVESKPPT